jgi:DNA-binding Lrp family transcriptional regulator
VTGEYDYVLRVALRNRRDLERFLVDRLNTISGIARIQTSLVVREVKRTTALPIGR